jgi:glycosyltransferase involved in cell wall biosynthesis
VSAVNLEVIERVKAYKTHRRSSSVQYRDRSKLAFIVQSFNRISNIDQLLAGLRHLGEHELIICEDGSLDGSHEKWMAHLHRPNDFLIHSNDLHEIRILDRAIRFACADIICIVQDDDLIPREMGWLETALTQFVTYPRLAIIGGFMGYRSFHPDPKHAKPIWGPAPFQFVHHVNVGPYFIRKQYYEALGGWDSSFSEAGEPGICFESELCLRAWINGYQVGYSFVPFKGPPGRYSLDGGTVLFSGAVRRQNQLRNQEKIYAMYAKHARRIGQLVRKANRTLTPRAPLIWGKTMIAVGICAALGLLLLKSDRFGPPDSCNA